MGNFTVAFSKRMPYGDPDYRSVGLDVKGEAEVSCPDRGGNETDVEFVQSLILSVIQEQLFKLECGMISYKDLPSRGHVIGQEVASALGAKNITINSFSITEIAPDADSMSRISSMEKMSSFTAQSTADQMKAMEEANKRAQQELSQMSLDQRRQAEDQAQKIMAAQAADMQRIMEQVNQMRGDAAGTAAATAPLAAAAPKSRFCTNCGAPRGKGKFCPRCGKPLT